MESNVDARDGAEAAVTLVPAAQYIRKSTDYQKYSMANQDEANHSYAAAHGFVIVHTYTDDGKSGLRLHGRDALKQLIEDVWKRQAPFKVILVYDVSRWGRFQDADESGYYEYICKRAGISVHYCAEQFENDGSPFSAIVKGIKRAMAGEYSRELSTKVFVGQSRLIRLGYRQGAAPGFGLRRLLIDQNGKPKQLLARGEYKSIQTDRVILVPGSTEHVETIRWMFTAFAHEGRSTKEIAKMLNERKITTDLGRPWSNIMIRFTLKNEKYVGNNVWNRRSFKLHKRHVNNDPNNWLRAEGAFEPIVDKALFDAVQAKFRRRSEGPSNEEMVEALRGLYNKHGYLSVELIATSLHDGVPSVSAYARRLGGLTPVYKLIGYQQGHGFQRPSNQEMLDALRSLLAKKGWLSAKLIDSRPRREVSSASAYQRRFSGVMNAYKLIGYEPPRAHRSLTRAQHTKLQRRAPRPAGRRLPAQASNRSQ